MTKGYVLVDAMAAKLDTPIFKVEAQDGSLEQDTYQFLNTVVDTSRGSQLIGIERERHDD
jgi:hypothetical protein